MAIGNNSGIFVSKFGFCKYKFTLNPNNQGNAIPEQGNWTVPLDVQLGRIVNFSFNYAWNNNTCTISSMEWKPGKIVYDGNERNFEIDCLGRADGDGGVDPPVNPGDQPTPQELNPLNDQDMFTQNNCLSIWVNNNINTNYGANKKIDIPQAYGNDIVISGITNSYFNINFKYEYEVPIANDNNVSAVTYLVEIKNIRIPKTSKYENNVVFTEDGVTELLTNIKQYPIINVEEVSSNDWDTVSDGQPSIKITHGNPNFGGTNINYKYIKVGSNIHFYGDNGNDLSPLEETYIRAFEYDANESYYILNNNDEYEEANPQPDGNTDFTVDEYYIFGLPEQGEGTFRVNINTDLFEVPIIGESINNLEDPNSTSGQFFRGDKQWSNELDGAFHVLDDTEAVRTQINDEDFIQITFVDSNLADEQNNLYDMDTYFDYYLSGNQAVYDKVGIVLTDDKIKKPQAVIDAETAYPDENADTINEDSVQLYYRLPEDIAPGGQDQTYRIAKDAPYTYDLDAIFCVYRYNPPDHEYNDGPTFNVYIINKNDELNNDPPNSYHMSEQIPFSNISQAELIDENENPIYTINNMPAEITYVKFKNESIASQFYTSTNEFSRCDANTKYNITTTNFFIVDSNAGNFDPSVGIMENINTFGSITTQGGIAAVKSIKGYKVHGAVFNDYAEYRHTNNILPGKCVIETGKGDLILSSDRLQLGANIVSDTFGFSIGESLYANTPIAVCGRVLAYPYEVKEIFKAGDSVCSGPNGTISRMSRDEIKEWPDAIIGTVSEIPQYETWGSDNINVDGRIWIKVK